MGNVGYNVNAQCPTERATYDQCQSALIKRLTEGGYDLEDSKCQAEFEALKKCTYAYIAARQQQYIDRRTSSQTSTGQHTGAGDDAVADSIQTFDLTTESDARHASDNTRSASR